MKKCLCELLALLLPFALLTGCWQEELPEGPDDMLPPFEEEAEDGPEGPALPQSFALPYTPGGSLDPADCADGMQPVPPGRALRAPALAVHQLYP